jgi:hypothetical protein
MCNHIDLFIHRGLHLIKNYDESIHQTDRETQALLKQVKRVRASWG